MTIHNDFRITEYDDARRPNVQFWQIRTGPVIADHVYLTTTNHAEAVYYRDKLNEDCWFLDRELTKEQRFQG